MKKLLSTLILTLVATSSFAQTDVTNFVPGSTLEGVNYYLPRTNFRIVVEAEKTVVTPGELNKYAFKYLRMKDVPVEPTTSWKIKNITLEPFGTPDRSKAYNIKVRSKTLAPLVSLTKDGILLGINKESTEKGLSELPLEKPATPVQNPKKYMSQEMLAANSTAKLAELCAQEIYDIRDSRSALIRGEADNTPKDGAQLKLMLDQLELQAETLEELFKGTIQTSTHIFVLTIDPQKEEEQIICRFSKHLGMVDADDLSGRPIYMNIKNLEVIPPTEENPAITFRKEKIERGVYYNMPARESVSIYDDEQTFVKAEYPMGQFGKVEILSNTLFNKNVTTKVSFFQTTGGVEKIEN